MVEDTTTLAFSVDADVGNAVSVDHGSKVQGMILTSITIPLGFISSLDPKMRLPHSINAMEATGNFSTATTQ